MGILEKIGLFTDVEDTSEAKSSSKKDSDTNSKVLDALNSQMPSNTSTGSSTSVLDEKVEHVDVVKQAYATLPTTTENIFVVEELLKNFSALPENQRYATLQSTLKTMGKDCKTFVMEAQTRKNAVIKALGDRAEAVKSESTQIQKEIQEAKAKIDKLTQRNLDLANGLDVSKKESQTEINRLDMIIKVLSPTEGGN